MRNDQQSMVKQSSQPFITWILIKSRVLKWKKNNEIRLKCGHIQQTRPIHWNHKLNTFNTFIYDAFTLSIEMLFKFPIFFFLHKYSDCASIARIQLKCVSLLISKLERRENEDKPPYKICKYWQKSWAVICSFKWTTIIIFRFELKTASCVWTSIFEPSQINSYWLFW